MRYRKSCPSSCNAPTECCPEYTPDFLKLAESYGANGIRVTKENEIAAALETGKNTLKVPTVIEFIIEPEENVKMCIRDSLIRSLIRKAGGIIFSIDFLQKGE